MDSTTAAETAAAALAEVQQQLTNKQERSLQLAKEKNELQALHDQLLKGTAEADRETSRDLEERCQTLTREVSELQATLESERVSKEESRERTEDIQRQLELALQRADEAAERSQQLEQGIYHREQSAELDRYRAVEEERRKWEEKEAIWLQQLQLQSQPRVQPAETHSKPQVPPGLCSNGLTTSLSPLAPPLAPSTKQTVGFNVPIDTSPVKTTVNDKPVPQFPECAQNDSSLSLAVMGQQLPPLPKFTGRNTDDSEDERFSEWLERLEMVALMYQWTEQAKLVNLVTRLRGPAYLFYQSCTAEQRSNYAALVKVMSKRFTPVSLQPMESSRFHERKQQPTETVDEYAQDLRKLYAKAYAPAARSTPETEAMAQMVLASQFVSGLIPRLKSKIVGTEGNIDQLLQKARFEEAKGKELSSQSRPNKPPFKKMKDRTVSSEGNSEVRSATEESTIRAQQRSEGRCYNCGKVGHRARDCPQRSQRQSEATGPSATKPKSVAQRITSTDKQETRDKIADLKRQLQEAEAEDALQEASATISDIITKPTVATTIGPSVMSEVLFEGQPVQALVDTGSTVTIVSLDFLLQVLLKNRPEGQKREEWNDSVRARLKAPTLTLRDYGGGELNVVGQIICRLGRGSYSHEAVVHVQKAAPVDLLLGTDVQSNLEIALLALNDKTSVNLLDGQSWNTPTPDDADSSTSQDAAQTPVPKIRLISATRLPPWHVKLIKAQAEGPVEEASSLFVPAVEVLQKHGLIITEGLTQPDAQGCVRLAIENHTPEPVHLEEGQVVGELEPAFICDHDDSSGSEGRVRAIEQPATKSATASPEIPVAIENELMDLSEPDLSSASKLLLRYAALFAKDDLDLGETDVVTHVIRTGDHAPIKQPPRRVPYALRKTVEEMVEKMQAQGVVRPSKSPWASPIVLVAKKDGSMQFCVDYRKLNAVTKMDVFPLPRIDDSLDLLAGAKYFTTLDLASGYWQVAMDEDSREKTAFVTHSGLFEFLKMPFGLCNAPATFQRLMEVVLSDLIRDRCVAYIDDIIVVGDTFESHLENLKRVFQRLEESGLKLKPAKCHFFQRTVEYLGHVVTETGVAPDPRKVQAMEEFPVPTNLKALRSFLGLMSYYRRFIPQFSVIAGPLFALTRKDVPFKWSQSCENAFVELKKRMTQAPVLIFPDFTKPFILQTDASGDGLGAVLAQQLSDNAVHPLAYASRTLQPHEKNYGVTELEALGVVWAVKHFRHYLYGHHCTVFTDHEALRSLLNTPHPSGKLARWGLALQELDLEIKYRPGRKNANADALSRAPVRQTVAAVTTTDPIVAAKGGERTLSERQYDDPTLRPMMEYLRNGQLPEDDKQACKLLLDQSQYVLLDDILYHLQLDKTLRLVPPTGDRLKLFHEAHSGVFSGHLRQAKMHGLLSKHYWWPTMTKDISSWCRGCLVCATRRTGRQVKPPMTPIEVAGPFDKVGVDVLQLPVSKSGNKYAVVFVDYLTKWPEVFPTKDQTTLTIAKLLVEHIIPRHGVPSELLSDRGRSFLSQLIQEMCLLMGTHKVNTSAYHPQCDGLVERFNRTLIDMLAKTVEKGGQDWDIRLPYVLFSYRASLQESTQESPFYLLYGRDPRLPTDAALAAPVHREDVDLDDYKAEVTSCLSDAWELARQHVKKAQKAQKRYYDRNTKDPGYRVGDRVFVFMPAAKQGKDHKFARPYHGPFRVLRVEKNNLSVVPVDKPQKTPIFVATDRVRRCPEEIEEGESWPARKQRREDNYENIVSMEKATSPSTVVSDDNNKSPSTTQTAWSGRLRIRRSGTTGT